MKREEKVKGRGTRQGLLPPCFICVYLCSSVAIPLSSRCPLCLCGSFLPNALSTWVVGRNWKNFVHPLTNCVGCSGRSFRFFNRSLNLSGLMVVRDHTAFGMVPGRVLPVSRLSE